MNQAWSSESVCYAKMKSGEIIKFESADADKFEAALKAGQIVSMSEEEIKRIISRGFCK